MKTKQPEFTLVELVMVISIIALLMGMILPAVSKAKEQAKKTQARTEMNSMKVAITQYETTYGYLPTASGADDNFYSGGTPPEYDELVGILSQTGSYASNGNLRKVKLLEVTVPGEYQDPWENDYQVTIDANYDGVTTATRVAGMNTGTDIPASVIIYCNGPDGLIHYSTPSHAANKDNLYTVPTSWGASGHSLK